MVGELAAAPGLEHWQPIRIQQVGGFGRDPGGVERRMFEQPDQLTRLARRDGGGAGLHRLDSLRIADLALRDRPAGRQSVLAQDKAKVGVCI